MLLYTGGNGDTPTAFHDQLNNTQMAGDSQFGGFLAIGSIHFRHRTELGRLSSAAWMPAEL
jgi:hypothetical protein